MTHSPCKRIIATIGLGLMTFGLSACGEAEPVAVPDVVGMPGNEARDILQGQDFKTDMNALDGSAVFNAGNWEVESTEPEAGDMVDPKSEVIVNMVRPEDEESGDESLEDTEEDASDFEVDHDDAANITTVRFEVRDHFTEGLMATGAHSDTVEALEIALEEHADTDQINVEATFPESDRIMLDPQYSRETIDQIDFDNARIQNIWEIRDGGAIYGPLYDNL